MKLNATLYPYQEEGVRFGLQNPYSIIGDEMGLGKTLEALGLAVRVQAPNTLIVCPAYLVPNWQRKIAQFVTHPSRFTVVSYHGLSKIARDFRKYACVVLDEAHAVKNLHAKRTQLIHELVQKHRPAHLMQLSGTPIRNRVPEIYSLLRLAWYGQQYKQFDIYSGSFYRFQETFTERKVETYGQRRVVKHEGMRNIAQLKALIRPIYIRRRTKEVGLNLPDMVHSDILMKDADKNDLQLKAAWDAYSGGEDRSSFSTAKAVNALAKVPYTVEFVTDLLDQARGVVVFSDHIQAAQAIAAEIPGARFITGATDVKTRDALVQDLNEGRLRVLVATIGALSVGVDITGVNYMVFNDFAWVEADMDQARKRIHRIGQTETCFYYYILSSKIDEYIFNTLKQKQKIMEALEDIGH